jgi:hypothetical protein
MTPHFTRQLHERDPREIHIRRRAAISAPLQTDKHAINSRVKFAQSPHGRQLFMLTSMMAIAIMRLTSAPCEYARSTILSVRRKPGAFPSGAGI